MNFSFDNFVASYAVEIIKQENITEASLEAKVKIHQLNKEAHASTIKKDSNYIESYMLLGHKYRDTKNEISRLKGEAIKVKSCLDRGGKIGVNYNGESMKITVGHSDLVNFLNEIKVAISDLELTLKGLQKESQQAFHKACAAYRRAKNAFVPYDDELNTEAVAYLLAQPAAKGI